MSDPGLASAPGQGARVLDIGPSRKQRRSSSVLRFSVVVRMLVPHPAAWRTLAQRRLCRCRPSSLTMPAKLSINDVDVAGKRVFMRVDFNVPQDRWASAMLLLWVFFLNSSSKVLLLSTVLIVSDSVQFPTKMELCVLRNKLRQGRTAIPEPKHPKSTGLATRPQDKADPTKITNTQRIDGALPTIKKARQHSSEGGRRKLWA